MALEIERKFLVVDQSWRDDVQRVVHIEQGYLNPDDLHRGGVCSVRIRLQGQCANINIKSLTLGVVRTEYEYDIPLDDGRQMLAQFCSHSIIEKQRFYVHHEQHLWEVDVFHGANEGLIVAEIELQDENESFAVPPWIGDEVSDDVRYYNVELITNPYCDW